MSNNSTRVNPQTPLPATTTSVVVSFDENLLALSPALTQAQINSQLLAARQTRDADRQAVPPVVVPNSVWQTLDTVNNPDNWLVTLNGVAYPGLIASVQFGLDATTNKYEATITFSKPLPAGSYTLTALHPVLTNGVETQSGIRDAAGNPLGLSGLTTASNGANSTTFAFSVGSSGDTAVAMPGTTNGHTYADTPGAVAVDGKGDHIVVWTATDPARVGTGSTCSSTWSMPTAAFRR